MGSREPRLRSSPQQPLTRTLPPTCAASSPTPAVLYIQARLHFQVVESRNIPHPNLVVPCGHPCVLLPGLFSGSGAHRDNAGIALSVPECYHTRVVFTPPSVWCRFDGSVLRSRYSRMCLQANFTRLTWTTSSPTRNTSTTSAPQLQVRHCCSHDRCLKPALMFLRCFPDQLTSVARSIDRPCISVAVQTRGDRGSVISQETLHRRGQASACCRSR